RIYVQRFADPYGIRRRAAISTREAAHPEQEPARDQHERDAGEDRHRARARLLPPRQVQSGHGPTLLDYLRASTTDRGLYPLTSASVVFSFCTTPGGGGLSFSSTGCGPPNGSNDISSFLVDRSLADFCAFWSSS